MHKRGYRFCASVTETAAAQLPPNNARVFGRNPEMESLRDLWKDACNGNRRIVLIAGEAGIGKSTLVQHFLYTVAHGNVRIARGQCVEHFGEPEPYYPVLDACSRLARESGGMAVADVLRQFAPTWLLQLPSVASSEDFHLLRAHVVGATKERMLREIADAINVLSSVDPVILVLEDLHWADSATVDLLSWIASKQDPARLLVIGTYRPVDAILSGHRLTSVRRELLGRRLCSEIVPSLLTPENVEELLLSAFPDHQFSAGFAARLHEHTEGNPLFLTTFLDYLSTRGVIAKTSGKWELVSGIDKLSLDIPEGLLQMIGRQIERLTPDELALLEGASAAGSRFTVRHLSDEQDQETFERMCESLASRSLFLRRDRADDCFGYLHSQCYAFLHSLYREVLYDNTPPTRRARLHREIGTRIEALTGDSTDAAAELAIHFEQARMNDRAVVYLCKAAATAASRFALDQAVTTLQRAQSLAEASPAGNRGSALTVVLNQLGHAFRLKGDLRSAAGVFEGLTNRAREANDSVAQLNAMLWRASAISWIDRNDCLSVVNEIAELLAGSNPDPVTEANVKGQLAYWDLLLHGWSESGLATCRSALEVIRGSGKRSLVSLHTSRLAFFLSLHTEHRLAFKAAEESIDAAVETINANDYSVAQFFGAWALLHGGRWYRFRSFIEKARHVAVNNRHELWSVLFNLLEAWLYIYAGRFADAVPLCEDASQRVQKVRHALSEQISAILLGHALAGAGRLNEAQKLLTSVSDWQGRERVLMDRIWQIPLRFAECELLLSQRRGQAALQRARDVSQLTGNMAEETWRGYSAWLLARAMILTCDTENALSTVEEALGASSASRSPLAYWRLHELRFELTGDETSRRVSERMDRRFSQAFQGVGNSYQIFTSASH
ncbi:MAG: AAA family ATPase [Bryobacteraceae bacterium]|nr:AAA family ATPase [Bryobacteraceae bacterium]